MSVCLFLASDNKLKTYSPPKEYPLEINLDNGEIYDGGADDNFFLTEFSNGEICTDRKNAVCLEWNYTNGRALQLIRYIKDALKQAESIELWKIWNDYYYEYDESPVVHKKTVTASELSTEDIKSLILSDIFNKPDKLHPNRPSFYCLIVTR
ncbi:MAG: hypothetical protein IKV76_03545 [Clostridia bacterium]|nr:hypothetical protein [Clostridia bacterium]